MEFTLKRTVQVTAFLLILVAVTQAIYTALYIAEADVPRQLLWGLEGLIFAILAAFAGSALVQAKRYTLGFSAIAFSAALNVVQVGVGLTMFGPFREVANEVEAFAPAAGAVVAFSFMVYNAAKVLLGLAAVVFGMAKMNAGGKALGGITVLVGVIAMVTNAIVMAFGRIEAVPSGAAGVIATILLALCLSSALKDD